MVKNKTSTSLLVAGFVIWIGAIFIMPHSLTAYLVVSGAAIGVFVAAIVVGLFYKRLFPSATEA